MTDTLHVLATLRARVRRLHAHAADVEVHVLVPGAFSGRGGEVDALLAAARLGAVALLGQEAFDGHQTRAAFLPLAAKELLGADACRLLQQQLDVAHLVGQRDQLVLERLVGDVGGRGIAVRVVLAHQLGLHAHVEAGPPVHLQRLPLQGFLLRLHHHLAVVVVVDFAHAAVLAPDAAVEVVVVAVESSLAILLGLQGPVYPARLLEVDAVALAAQRPLQLLEDLHDLRGVLLRLAAADEGVEAVGGVDVERDEAERAVAVQRHLPDGLHGDLVRLPLSPALRLRHHDRQPLRRQPPGGASSRLGLELLTHRPGLE